MHGMSDDEYKDFLATMYGGGEEEADTAGQPVAKEDCWRAEGHFTVVRLGGEEFTVPNVAYLRKLENEVQVLTRQIKKLQIGQRLLQQELRRMGGHIDDVRHDLGNKMDRRGEY